MKNKSVKVRKKLVKSKVKSKSNKFLKVGSSCAGALVVLALLVNYQKSDTSSLEEVTSQESDKGLQLIDIDKGDAVVISNSVNESSLTLLEVPKVASASMVPEMFAYNSVEVSEEVQLTSVSTEQVPDSSSQEGNALNMPARELSSYFEIGADYTHVNFKPQGNSSFHGNLGGLQGSYEYKPKDNFYAGVNFSWKEGQMHGSDGKRSLLYIDAQERLGYTVAVKSLDYTFTVFSGLGYRHFGQKLTPNVGSSLKFRYNEFYIPVGIKSDYVVNSWFEMGLDFTWMPQVYPTVSIVPLKGSRWILTDRLANFYVNLPMNFTVTKDKRFHIVVDPFYERWQDGHSTAETSKGVALGLPGNTYNFWGANVNFLYCF